MSNYTNFKQVPENPNFSKEEEEILKYWDEIDAFKTQLKLTENKKPFTFYDGPPFATGLPHYGHILAGTIKDVVCRYASQTGNYVERRFGWDCHGLPIEYEIDKIHKITCKNDVLKLGIDNYNNLCKGIVMKYSKEWRTIVNRCGRWIDFDNDYKTMDIKFMESIWAVFKVLFDKGYVYRGCRIMPYSNACGTVLSNFEVQQNYKETNDPAIYVTFPLVATPEVKLIAWTTTPWTLPSNLMLAVNANFDYVKLRDKALQQIFIIAECRLNDLYKSTEDYEVLEKFKGSTLEGLDYEPLYPYFYNQFKQTGGFKIACGDFVTEKTGTGVVHCAPGFGEEDYQICIKYKVINIDNPPVPLDDNGNFTEQVSDYKGVYVKTADKDIRKELTKRGRLIKDTQITHNYPFCWRSDTPLIYKAVHCWFIKVTAVKEDLLKNNQKSKWIPKNVQEGRFNNWLEDARDWCFSRNRFWGNPIPIWGSDDGQELVCIGSVEELKQKSGYQGEILDLHRDHIDHITIPSSQGKGQLKRIDEVFDCWFESGSMPYGQCHWPFSISEKDFDKRFPADFIGEGIDQTRGWFYTLNVIATMLKNDTPYKNLIVNGTVLAENGKKMSKRDKNYPDPQIIIDKFGADAVRLYLINSPLVRAQDMNFKESGLKDTIKNVFLPWYNAYRLLIQNVIRWENSNQKNFSFDEKLAHSQEYLTNSMDRWITVSCMNLVKYVREEMENYRLYTVVPRLLEFLEQLTNWYVRLNRPRLKGDKGENEAHVSLTVLTSVVIKITILMSPCVPFITDMMYQNLVKMVLPNTLYHQQSVHFLDIPQVIESLCDEKYEKAVRKMQDVIALVRKLRLQDKLSLKQPIQSLTIVTNDKEWIQSLDVLQEYIKDEINTPTILFDTNIDKYATLKLNANHNLLGKRLGKKYGKEFQRQINEASKQTIEEFGVKKTLTIEGEELKLGDEIQIVVSYQIQGQQDENLVVGGEQDFCVILDKRQDDDLKQKGTGREFTNRIQKLRKDSGLQPQDDILIFINAKTEGLKKYLSGINYYISKLDEAEPLKQQLKRPIVDYNKRQGHLALIDKTEQNYKFKEEEFDVSIYHNHVRLSDTFRSGLGEGLQAFEVTLRGVDYVKAKEEALKTGQLVVGDRTLKKDQDFFIGWEN